MGRDEDPDAASSSRRSSAASTDSRVERIEATTAQSQPDEQKKQKKHGRVHKREKELYGLVTPVFLPLLDARESTSPEKKPALTQPTQPTQPSPKHADSAPPHTQSNKDMPGDTPTKERSASDPIKKRRSSIKKKSALRHNSTSSSAPRNRKRVSLVIDDQVVLPSDIIAEPALTSPGSETTSATTSTASLDDMIDPRLTSDAPVFIEHSDGHAVHHSLPLSMAHPAKQPEHPNPAPIVTEPQHSPPTSPNVRSLPLPYAPPSYATRSFLDPPPEAMHIEDLPSIPHAAGPEPIFPDIDDVEDEFASQVAEHDDQGFQTYVGGLSGSGVDDVNQVGSVGYPSSLGASYLESYMQGRPLSVRMAAAEREGDENEMRKLRNLEERRKKRESEEKAKHKVDREEEEDWGAPPARSKDVDNDDFMGSMDDF